MDEKPKPKVEPNPEKGGSSPPMQKKQKAQVGPAPTDDPNAHKSSSEKKSSE
jgi:hypothetical protein